MATITKRGSSWFSDVRRRGIQVGQQVISPESAANEWARSTGRERDDGNYRDGRSLNSITPGELTGLPAAMETCRGPHLPGREGHSEGHRTTVLDQAQYPAWTLQPGAARPDACLILAADYALKIKGPAFPAIKTSSPLAIAPAPAYAWAATRRPVSSAHRPTRLSLRTAAAARLAYAATPACTRPHESCRRYPCARA